MSDSLQASAIVRYRRRLHVRLLCRAATLSRPARLFSIGVALVWLASSSSQARGAAPQRQAHGLSTWSAHQQASTPVMATVRAWDVSIRSESQLQGAVPYAGAGGFEAAADPRRKARQGPWFIFASLAVVVILLACVFRQRTGKRSRRRVDRFQDSLAERERVLRSLHDSLLQNFQGLVLRLHAALKPLPAASDTRRNIESILDQADAVLSQARQDLTGLGASPGDGEHEFDEALAAFGRSLEVQFGPGFKLVLCGDKQTLDMFARHELYMIGREALFNAYQHAQATHIELELEYGPESFKLIVRDDGIGMDENVPCGKGRTRHWGLAGMKERAASLGGSLELWSRPGAGTEVLARAPARRVYTPGSKPGLRPRLLALLARSAS